MASLDEDIPPTGAEPEARPADGIVVIGEVSVVKSVLLIIGMTAFLLAILVQLPSLWNGGAMDVILAVATILMVGAGFGLYIPSLILQAMQRDRVFYVQNNRIHWRTLRDHHVASVDDLRAARRESPRPESLLRSQLIVVFERHRGGRPRWAPPGENEKIWTIDTAPFHTPISVMLDRLEALGARIEGSKTARFDLGGRR